MEGRFKDIEVEKILEGMRYGGRVGSWESACPGVADVGIHPSQDARQWIEREQDKPLSMNSGTPAKKLNGVTHLSDL